MQSQHISDIYPNVISITKIRQDIDALMDLLEKYRRVKVLRGQTVLFEVMRPESEDERREKMRKAVGAIRSIAKKHSRKKGEKSLTEILIAERDRMRTKEYYAKHNR